MGHPVTTLFVWHIVLEKRLPPYYPTVDDNGRDPDPEPFRRTKDAKRARAREAFSVIPSKELGQFIERKRLEDVHQAELKCHAA
eukprot:4470892-Amphidinium_carterae.1